MKTVQSPKLSWLNPIFFECFSQRHTKAVNFRGIVTNGCLALLSKGFQGCSWLFSNNLRKILLHPCPPTLWTCLLLGDSPWNLHYWLTHLLANYKTTDWAFPPYPKINTSMRKPIVLCVWEFSQCQLRFFFVLKYKWFASRSASMT